MPIRPRVVAFDVVQTLMSLEPLRPRFTDIGLRADAVDRVLAGLAELPAQPDAEPAMRLLAETGIAQVCLSNGAAKTTTAFLERTGLREYVERVISIDEVRQWKPSPNVYAHALRMLDRPAEEVALVAVHAFDCHGARRAGMTTGWASRLEGSASAATFGQHSRDHQTRQERRNHLHLEV